MTLALSTTRSSVVQLLLLLLLCHPNLLRISAQRCEMEIWVFDTLTRCNDTQPPNALGTMHADGDCHAVTVSDSDSTEDVSLFPGNYRAVCTGEGKVRFLDSGCTSETCGSTSLVTSETAICDRNAGTISSLYSRLEVPEYVVQDKREATVGGYYTCLRLKGADDSTVTFVVFGDCSQADCQIADETTLVPSIEGTEPTSTPVVGTSPTAGTTEPTVGDAETAEPTVAVIESTDPPTTEAPVVAPTTEEIPSTLSPVTNPTSDSSPPPMASPAPSERVSQTTLAPQTGPITGQPIVLMAPTDAPVVTPAETAPTNEPDVSNPTDSPETQETPTTPMTQPGTTPTTGTPPTSAENGVMDTFSVTLLFFPGTTELDAEALSDWETQTKTHIIEASQATGATVLDLSLSKVRQTLNAVRRGLSGRRFLQQGSLRIDFDVAMRYLSSTDESLSSILASAFDSEQDRFKYLRRFELEPLSTFSKVQFTGVDGTPVGIDGDSSIKKDSASGNNNTTLAAIGAGAAGIVLIVVGLLVHKKRKGRQSEKSSTGMTKTHEIESPSSYGGMPVEKINGAASPQRWTNEILVDPSADDVSTLGGSVLAGFNLVENNTTQNGEDEPTASVNLDYDYGKSRYRTEVDDRTRSHMTEGSAAPTAFTNYSKLGMNVNSVYADDASFEQQFAEPDEDEDYHNRSMVRKDDRASAAAGSDMNSRVKPFEVRAPPGKLGMVVDTPHGGVPVVRAIKADSVLTGRVVIGDRLISVDYQDVTNMTALEVSSLISLKQDQARLLIFCRLTPPASAMNSTA